MNKVEPIGGVTKRYLGNSITYLFPLANIFVDTSSDSIQIQYLAQQLTTDSTLFSDLDENYGTTDAESYVDYLAVNKFFFDPTEGGGATDVNIVSQSAGLALDSSIQSLIAGQGSLSQEATQLEALQADASNNRLSYIQADRIESVLKEILFFMKSIAK